MAAPPLLSLIGNTPSPHPRTAWGVSNTNSLLGRRGSREETNNPLDDKNVIAKYVGEGCGRVVCRNCSMEDPQKYVPYLLGPVSASAH